MEEKAKTSKNKQIEVREGFIYFSKNGIINIKTAPKFGEVRLFYKNGKLTHSEASYTDKHE